jgi:AcrR family transcriptional regulator
MADPRVSKGGLLYHLRSKGALIDGLAERLRAYTEANMALARREGVVRTFLATSTPGSQESAHYWAVLTAMRGSKTDVSAQAAQTLHDVSAQWSVRLREEAADPVLAQTDAAGTAH